MVTPEDREPEDNRQMIYLALSIPALMAAGPIVGYFLGMWIGGIWNRGDLGGVIGLLLGFVSGARESIKVIRRLYRKMGR
ncbi:MAG: hypothetical protein ACLFUS_02580 [Candidatus Sumerlaeia bacterium]